MSSYKPSKISNSDTYPNMPSFKKVNSYYPEASSSYFKTQVCVEVPVEASLFDPKLQKSSLRQSGFKKVLKYAQAKDVNESAGQTKKRPSFTKLIKTKAPAQANQANQAQAQARGRFRAQAKAQARVRVRAQAPSCSTCKLFDNDYFSEADKSARKAAKNMKKKAARKAKKAAKKAAKSMQEDTQRELLFHNEANSRVNFLTAQYEDTKNNLFFLLGALTEAEYNENTFNCESADILQNNLRGKTPSKQVNPQVKIRSLPPKKSQSPAKKSNKVY